MATNKKLTQKAGSAKRQETRRKKFTDAGFKRLEMFISDSTEELLFELMKNCGYQDYAIEGSSKGKTLDVSNFLTFLIKDAAINESEYNLFNKELHNLLMISDIHNHLKSQEGYEDGKLRQFLNDNNFAIPNSMEDKKLKGKSAEERIRRALKTHDAEEFSELL